MSQRQSQTRSHAVMSLAADNSVRVPATTRLWRGIICWLSFVVTPFGWFCSGRQIRRLEPERLDRGLVLVLTGIEGQSFLNVGLLAGLIDGGIQSAVEIIDWTTGYRPLVVYHLRALSRNRRVAQGLANRIVQYQDRYPGRPVWLVGHSGGAGMALLVAEAMPEDRKLTGIVMLAAATSPQFDPSRAISQVQTKVWNYYSWLDAAFLIVFTTLAGTIDGPHGIASGAIGLRSDQAREAMAAGRLVQVCWNWKMLFQFNPGEHFGCVHRVFVAEEIAPLITATEQAATAESEMPHRASA